MLQWASKLNSFQTVLVQSTFQHSINTSRVNIFYIVTSKLNAIMPQMYIKSSIKQQGWTISKVHHRLKFV